MNEVKKNYRNGDHLLPFMNPFLGPQLQAITLRKLRERIGIPRCKEIEKLIAAALIRRGPITLQLRDVNTNFASYMTQMLYDLTEQPPTVTLTLDPVTQTEWQGVRLHTLTDTPLSETCMYTGLIPIWLVMTYRAICQGSAATFPGLVHNISPAGLHFMLGSLGMEVES